MTTTTSPIRDHLLHGEPTKVMGDVALLEAHGALRGATKPVPHPSRPGEIVVKVLVDSRIAVPRKVASTAVALRQPAVPARAVPLRHPAAKPGWSTKKKLAVAGSVTVAASAGLGWLVSQLLTLDLQAMAATAVGFFALAILVVAAIAKATGGCAGIHCGGCSSH